MTTQSLPYAHLGEALATDYFQIREQFTDEQWNYLITTRRFVCAGRSGRARSAGSLMDERPRSFHFLRHALCPLIGAAVMLLPIYGSVWPWPEWPANLITVLAFVWIILGVLVGYRLRSRSGDVLERVGQILTSSSL